MKVKKILNVFLKERFCENSCGVLSNFYVLQQKNKSDSMQQSFYFSLLRNKA